jgi:imidazole glycerol-phosphate synthase subunit HisF
MLKTRIIPTLLWKDVGLVKGMKFDSWRRVGTVLPAIKVYNTREVDELILVDITATREGNDPDYDSIADFTAECFVPLTVGGGVKNLEQIKKLLRAGADKIAINSAAYSDPNLIQQAANLFGKQCVVVSIDARQLAEGQYECYSHSGTQATGQQPHIWAKTVAALGAGEILLTSIDHDGTMQGYDLELIRQVAASVNIPVIASGGAGNYEDMYQAIVARASAVAAASIFHFTEQTPLAAKKYLENKGVPTRRVNIL